MAPPRGGGHPGVMSATPRAPRLGTTLIEVLTVLAVLATLLGLAALPLRATLDRVAAAAARDAVASALVRARTLAVARGGARVVLELEPPRAHLLTAGGELVGDPLDLGAAYGVAVSADGNAGVAVDLRFDAYGIGRMASRTLRFRRGAAEARLTLSSYGRVRPW